MPHSLPDSTYHLRVGRQGRVVLPADLRRKLDIREGCHLEAKIERGQLSVETVDHPLDRAIRRVQAKVPGDVSLVDRALDAREQARKLEHAKAERLYGEDAP